MKSCIFLLAVAVSFMPARSLNAAPRARTTIENTIDVLDDLDRIPESSVPSALVREAHAVIIAPNLLKGGFLFAGRHGHGILLIRGKDGGWGNPIFVSISGGSVGFQVGLQSTDLFLVVRDRRSLDRILRGAGKLTLGADASVAAGPLGRQAALGTDAQMHAEILSYSRSRGIFAGVAIEGDTLQVDREANETFYGKRAVTVAEIVEGKVAVPEAATSLHSALVKMESAEPKRTPRLELPRLPDR